ncbi:MAG: hypothetical protein KZQ83_19000 [gamma proteobacterium symbiont of Taylorina sp.]|nr:hypothetical protein [gamma proteobacterium symbiont of Taylorina sp.]
MINFCSCKFLIWILLLFSLPVSAAISIQPAAIECAHIHRKIGLVLSMDNKNSPYCQIKKVIPLSPAWYSRLKSGDKINTVNQQQLKPDQPCQDFKTRLQKLQYQQIAISLEVISQAVKHSVIIPEKNQTQDLARIKFNTVPLDLAAADKPLSTLQNQLQNKLDSNSITPLYQSLSCLTAQSPAALPIVKTIQHNPLKLFSAIESINQHLIPAETTLHDFVLSDFLSKIQTLNYPLSPPPKAIPLISHNCTANSLFQQLEEFLSASHQLSRAAFADIDNQQTHFFMTHYTQLSDSISQSHSIMNEQNEDTLEVISQLLAIASRVDMVKLFHAAGHWLQLVNPDWLVSLQSCLSQLNNPVPVQKNTAFGKIIIGTASDDSYNIHPQQENIALLIDPAGNDYYRQDQNRTSSTQSHLYNTAIIDLAGDDQYDAGKTSGFAFAALGNALLVDLSGNDQYKARYWAQGSAFAGIAALYDHQGNDSYRAESFSQAMALFGSGLLIDHEGNDNYSLRHHGQALGLPYGHAVLMDGQGNDHYKMHNGLTSSYLNSALQSQVPLTSSESWGQGCGKGFRNILPGGLGILIDIQGKDSFSAHEFAQGGGYYYGMGLLYNLGNNDDHYQGSRYNNGFSAHQAIGGLIESGGNDDYETTGSAFCGTAWDQSISLFYDQSGDDTYSGKDFSFAAAAHNSIASFWDISGQDKFIGTINPAFISSNEYHGGQSLSYFFSADKDIPQRMNIDKHEFVITSPDSLQNKK